MARSAAPPARQTSFAKVGRARSITAMLALASLAATCHAAELTRLLDAPLLFVKRHAYMAGHIYDDYYTWHPGGGIYVIENPSAPPEQRRVRGVIDAQTKETLGVGVYRDPELSWDAKRILFAFKGAPDGDTSIYEIGIDGSGLRRLTEPGLACRVPMPTRAFGKGRHDISPCYLPDGRIVFTSTRQGGRVPCFNSEVDTLHIMNADGSGVRPLSVNNVNEFDPAVLPDGRILFGRWEYVDKTALYMQSLWTVFPDGTHETALFGNNLAKPTAILDARPVPDSHLIVASLTPHNGQSVGAIAMIDPRLGKNDLKAIFNFTPEYPTEMDQGLKRGPCDPWPLSEDVVLISNNGQTEHSVLEIIDRSGRRERVHAEPDIGCFSPMLVKPRPTPLALNTDAPAVADAPGYFFVQDIYEGLTGVQRGGVTRLRVIEETARISGIPDGGRWWNQAFLLSWQGAYSVKNFLGTVPVEADGSVHFEAPPGRALYFQALDRQNNLVQSMRTFVQAVPGSTRSCVGCHEYKQATPVLVAHTPLAQQRAPDKIQPESWGSGFIDYPTMVQPVLDRHCASCHGGEKGIAGGIDLSGGWTWAFNISYETLIKNTQVGFLNCVNEAVKTAEVQPPRTHGSGASPLSKLLLSGHDGQIPDLTRTEIDLLLAWMDGNCNYYGTWDWSEQAICAAILKAGEQLAETMKRANCTQCHSSKVGNDWINLQRPELSRILRAPLAEGNDGHGLGWCRERKARDVLALVRSPAQPPDVFHVQRTPPPDTAGQAVATFASTADTNYQAMLAVIRSARHQALARPRVDMPGAAIHAGATRQLVPPPLPEKLPPFEARLEPDGVVALSWERSADTIGLVFELHRSARRDFKPDGKTFLAETTTFHHLDCDAPPGEQHYALVLVSDEHRSRPVRTSLKVTAASRIPAPQRITVVPLPGAIQLSWQAADLPGLRFNIHRQADDGPWQTLNSEPTRAVSYTDENVVSGIGYRYRVEAISRRDESSPHSEIVAATPMPERKEPVFAAAFDRDTVALMDAGSMTGKLHGKARVEEGALNLSAGGHVTFPRHAALDLRDRFSVECRVRLDEDGRMPVLICNGSWRDKGWFLQKVNHQWRWHLGGVDCDGGRVATRRWIHLVATFDGQRAALFQDGELVASVSCQPARMAWAGPLFIGQYGPSPGEPYQVAGQIADVRIYHRAISATQAAALFKSSQAAKP